MDGDGGQSGQTRRADTHRFGMASTPSCCATAPGSLRSARCCATPVPAVRGPSGALPGRRPRHRPRRSRRTGRNGASRATAGGRQRPADGRNPRRGRGPGSGPPGRRRIHFRRVTYRTGLGARTPLRPRRPGAVAAGLHNGSTGTVVAVDTHGLRVAFDRAGQVTLARRS